MIFKFAENRCILKVLEFLEESPSRYSDIFRETKFSHSTLQSVLSYLAENGFIDRKKLSYNKVEYSINSKGKELLKKLKELENYLK